MKCHQKARFKSKAKARKYQGLNNRNGSTKMHVYKCPTCKNYHLSKFRKAIVYSKLCDRPIYKTTQDAEVVRTEQKKRGLKYLRIYECTKCNGYHVSRPRK